MLSLRGNGLKASWNDVHLEPVADRFFTSWGGYGALSTSANGGRPSSSDLPPWVRAAAGPAAPGEFDYTVQPNLSPPLRLGTISIGARSSQIFQLGLPAPDIASTVQMSLFRPRTPDEVLFSQGTMSDFRGSFGLAGDQGVMGDWTGTGIVRMGVYRAGRWYLDLNNNGKWDGVEGGDGVYDFGLPGDIAVVGDWTGDGITKIGIFRRGLWVLDANNNRQFDPADPSFVYGMSGDLPAVGKWKAGSRADQAGVFRNGLWMVDSNGDRAWGPSDENYHFGQVGDIPIVSRTQGKIGIFRSGQLFLDANGNHVPDSGDVRITAGVTDDQILMGEW